MKEETGKENGGEGAVFGTQKNVVNASIHLLFPTA